MNGESSNSSYQEEGDEDRISDLPINVLDHILDRIPIRDAARASSLSRKWRNIWTAYPHLAFDKKFTEEIKKNRNIFLFQVDYVNVINRILLQHEGAITKFVLHFPEMPSFMYGQLSYIDNWNMLSNIDHWMLFLAKKGVKELTLLNSTSVPCRLPSYVFSFHELTNLSITKFIFGAPKWFKGFSKLTRVILEEVTFESSVLAIPQLVVLFLKHCKGTRFLDVSASSLKVLILCQNDDFELSNYAKCKKLWCVFLASSDAVKPNNVSLATIFGCWPMLSSAYFDGYTLKYLTAGFASGEIPTGPNRLKYLSLFPIKFDLDEIASIFHLLRSASNLQMLAISAGQKLCSHIELAPYLEEPGFNHSMDKLKTVKMKYFKGSRAEIFFVKTLLAASPSLEKLCIEESIYVVPSSEILKELIQLPRASPKAQIFCQPILKRKDGSK